MHLSGRALIFRVFGIWYFSYFRHLVEYEPAGNFLFNVSRYFYKQV